MVTVLVILTWVGVAVANFLFVPKATLIDYGENKGKGRWVAYACIGATVAESFLADPLAISRLVVWIVLYTTGTALSLRALHDNPFFRAVIEAPLYRVTDGIYRYCCHPGYLGFSMRFLGISYLIGTLAAFVTFGVYVTFLFVRAKMEDAILREIE